jgi:hypothetical protein
MSEDSAAQVVAGAEIAAIVLGRLVLRLLEGPLVAVQTRGVPVDRMGLPLHEAGEAADHERMAAGEVAADVEEARMEVRQLQQLVVNKPHRDMARQ